MSKNKRLFRVAEGTIWLKIRKLTQSMKSRWFICMFTVAAYTVSLAHSVLPHHHYSSFLEYEKSVDDSNHKSGAEHSQDHNDRGHAGQELPDSLFFLTHVSNVDFSPSKFSFDQKVNVEILWPHIWIEDSSIADTYFAESLFHIPDSPLRVDNPTLSSRSLRAPPSII